MSIDPCIYSFVYIYATMSQLYNTNLLIQKINNGEAVKFLFFWGHTNKLNEAAGKFCFSQWYELPFEVEGKTYKTAEHWMMAHKALLFGNHDIYEKIIRASKPGEVKELGRQVTGFDEATWKQHRYDIVKQGNLHKFSQHLALAQYLKSTANRLIVEASPVDNIWGIGLAQDHEDAANPAKWRGENLLGFALMEVRDLLK